MTLNILKNDYRDDTPIEMSAHEFWKLWLRIKNVNLTDREIDVAADFYTGTEKAIKGNYKTYVERLQKKGIPLKKMKTPNELTLQINVKINE
jgi:hypothetical protein